jgi:hypothetical protein
MLQPSMGIKRLIAIERPLRATPNDGFTLFD